MPSTIPYWCTESLVVTVQGPQGRSTTIVDKPFARIGSHPRSEIFLKGTGIDARCLYLHATSEGVFCVRLLPTQRIPAGSGTWLRPDDVLQVGPYQISVTLQRASTQSLPRVALTAWGSAAPPLPVCEIFLDGKIRDKRRFRARLNLVGRRREHALQLQGQQVSSCHCALFWESGKLWSIDLLSSNGTLWQDEPIDCVLLEMGQALQIGEFSLLLKRLSRATLRPSAWRTGESDEDLLGEGVPSNEALASAGSMAQTMSAASGDTGKAPPTPENRQLTKAATREVTQGHQLLEGAHAEIRKDQELLHNEFALRSQELIAQRQQLDEQLQKTTNQVASQVSHLQTESALLAAQRQEVERLRAEWEEQRRVLTEDLTFLKEELSQHQTLLNEHKRLVSHSDAPAIASLSELVNDSAESPEELTNEAFRSEADNSTNELSGSPLQRGSLSCGAPHRTVIEGSYVVEKETPLAEQTPRRLPSVSTSPQIPVKPIGRRRVLEASAPVPVPETLDADASPRTPDASANQGSQGLTVVEHAKGATSDVTPSRIGGRRKAAQEDHLSEFVTDRLALREGSRRFWLRVLWGFAGIVSLLALATLGYIVLNAR
jgi:pSer/pThr/pTyr-binding forkhead associated (FHA) protein